MQVGVVCKINSDYDNFKKVEIMHEGGILGNLKYPVLVKINTWDNFVEEFTSDQISERGEQNLRKGIMVYSWMAGGN